MWNNAQLTSRNWEKNTNVITDKIAGFRFGQIATLFFSQKKFSTSQKIQIFAFFPRYRANIFLFVSYSSFNWGKKVGNKEGG